MLKHSKYCLLSIKRDFIKLASYQIIAQMMLYDAMVMVELPHKQIVN